jgi:hypothetical protein
LRDALDHAQAKPDRNPLAPPYFNSLAACGAACAPLEAMAMQGSDVGAFTRGQTSDAAKDLWAQHLGFAQGQPARDAGLGGERLHTAPPLPRLGGPDDPGRMVKDWNFYKYRPNLPMASSLNRYGPDFRWPGLNNTPEVRHHLAIIKRPKPKLPLNPLIWTDLPRMEPGPGQDHIAKRYEADLQLEVQRVEGFRHHRRSMKQHLSTMTANREALQLRAFSEPDHSAR